MPNVPLSVAPVVSTTSSKPLNPRAIAFGRQLRAVMLEQDVSSRELGRRLSGPSLTAQAGRRLVMKYLRGEVLPNPERRGEIAAVLGVDHSRFTVDEDDEEADLYAALFDAFKAIARHEAHREFARERRTALEEPPSDADRVREIRPSRAASALPLGGSSSAASESTALDSSQAGPTGHTPLRASQSALTKGA